LDARRALALLFCLLSLSLAQIDETAAGRGDRSRRNGDVTHGQALISADRAATIAGSATGGRVLDIRLTGGKQPQYRVKVLLDGKRVRNLSVDAQSGAILR